MASIRIDDLRPLEPLSAKQSVQVKGARSGRQARLGLETLEGRAVPATVTHPLPYQPPSTDLVINGTSNADYVTITPGADVAHFVATVNGVSTTYSTLNYKRIVANLGDGNDTFVNNTGVPCVVHGGNGDDTIIGGSGNDVLYGDAGNDYLAGNDGDDVLYAGTGAGVGDAYNDPMHGDPDTGLSYFHNSMEGGNGNDKMYGAEGPDVMIGGDGNDEMYGYGGNDVMFGGEGNDTMAGGDGFDVIVGQGGNDVLWGGDVGQSKEGYTPTDQKNAPMQTLTVIEDLQGHRIPFGPPVACDVLFGDYGLDNMGHLIPDQKNNQIDNFGTNEMHGAASDVGGTLFVEGPNGQDSVNPAPGSTSLTIVEPRQ
jgi:Ca2+-binding RTX toxin-like protein